MKEGRWISMQAISVSVDKETSVVRGIMKGDDYKTIAYCHNGHGVLWASKEFNSATITLTYNAANLHSLFHPECLVETANTGSSYMGHG